MRKRSTNGRSIKLKVTSLLGMIRGAFSQAYKSPPVLMATATPMVIMRFFHKEAQALCSLATASMLQKN